MNEDKLKEILTCKSIDPAVRNDFPMLAVKSHGQPFAYLNNAATSLKPRPVLEAMSRYYQEYGSSVFRGVDSIAYKATQAFEATRYKVKDFIGAKQPESIVFTSGATAGLNLVCQSFAAPLLQPGDELVVGATEHHANYVPWQQLCKQKRARLVLAPNNERGEVTPELLASVMTDKTRLVAVCHMSNVMGAVNDLKALAEIAHRHGAYLVADGAQGIVHERPDVAGWDVDFYAFSAHKIYGPTGVGVLYGKYDLLESMPPMIYGGEMIDVVDVADTTFRDPPYRFEGGTPPIAEVIGLGAALDYINSLGYCCMQQKTLQLCKRVVRGLQQNPNVEIYNPDNYFSGIVSFNVKGVHPHDAASIYDREGIQVRAGHHCAQPAMRWLHQSATLRASFAFYNNEEEADRLVTATKKAGDFLDVFF
ncbi:MAG: SufS family cysteine desulfurase [Oscillospiraceae bacterium]|nr:SufS family cysteine desulfurase [Oscillospiraceae bacterium]